LLSAAVAVWPGSTARAQGHTPDPYNIVGDYNIQYEPYVYATQPTPNSFFPGQARMMQDRAGNRAANRFQSFVDSLDGFEPEPDVAPPLRRGGMGTPYYRAYRRYDEDFQRVYRPNEAVDRAFYSEQQQRNQKYFDAINAKDPRKRAQLLREYNIENLRAARGLSNLRNAPPRERTAPAAADPDLLTPPDARRSPASGTRVLPSPGTGSALNGTRPAPRNDLSAPRPGTRPRTTPTPAPLGGAPRASSGTAGAGRQPLSDSTEPDDLMKRANRAIGTRAPAPRSRTAAPAPPR
jgi:hypothetical protein